MLHVTFSWQPLVRYICFWPLRSTKRGKLETMPNFGWTVCIIVSNYHTLKGSLEHHRRVLLQNASIPRLRNEHTLHSLCRPMKWDSGVEGRPSYVYSVGEVDVDLVNVAIRNFLLHARDRFLPKHWIHGRDQTWHSKGQTDATRKNCIKSSEKARHLIAMNEKKCQPPKASLSLQRSGAGTTPLHGLDLNGFTPMDLFPNDWKIDGFFHAILEPSILAPRCRR